MGFFVLLAYQAITMQESYEKEVQMIETTITRNSDFEITDINTRFDQIKLGECIQLRNIAHNQTNHNLEEIRVVQCIDN